MLLRWTRNAILANHKRLLSLSLESNELTVFHRYCTKSKDPAEAKPSDGASGGLEKVILLHNDDGKVIGSRTLQFAHDLAKRRKMGLVQIPSPTRHKDWYKIVAMKEVAAEGVDKSDKKTRFEAKTTHIGVNISDHDLGIKMKQIAKWIGQGHGVRVSVIGSMQTTKDQLVGTLNRIKSLSTDFPHEFSENKPSGGSLRCSFQPPKNEASKSSGKS